MNYRELLLRSQDGPVPENEWLHLSDNPVTPQDPVDQGARDFLASNAIERRLFYQMFPWHGRLIAWYLIRTGGGRLLIQELLLVQHLLRAESAEELQYTMLCYSLECQERSSLLRCVFGLRCSAGRLSALGQGAFANPPRSSSPGPTPSRSTRISTRQPQPGP